VGDRAVRPDVQEVTNFFERRVSAYQVGVSGDVVLDGAF